MKQAVWNGTVIAESDRTIRVEGNDYFPMKALRGEYFRDSAMTTRCPWKGTAHYYTVVVDGRENPDAAWYYPRPSVAASKIRDHVAFWHGVEVRDTDATSGAVTASEGSGQRSPGWRRWFGARG
ncbi:MULTISPECIES: DUF427 domain-containing protein [unclassified Nocardia]|uniref:DUF427 domain-containing protein n=1 Tax=unclassified Nocardia TaxID=2637762 RepID=UPI00278BDB99|nr:MULTISPECIES: DUF427 domain-containing protein [unclassified Nocardia]